MMEEQKEFKGWAIVEIMGHNKEIGYVTTEYYGPVAMFRIDQPDLPEREYVLQRPQYVSHKWMPEGTTVKRTALPAKSSLVGPSSIFRMTVCTEETARAAIEEMLAPPLIVLHLPAPLLDTGLSSGIDPVCGEPATGTITESYKRKTYGFCCSDCHLEFLNNPDLYVAQEENTIP